MPKIKRICEHCGKVFRVWPSNLRKRAVKYCSNTCKGIASRTKIKRKCKQCNKVFWARPSSVKSGYGIYCSVKCQHKGKRNRIKKECYFCGKTISIPPYRIAKRNYCSMKCLFLARRRRKYRKCRICGKRFWVWASVANENKYFYCSKKCFHARPLRTFKRKCKNCGKAFSATPSQVKLRGANFCSRGCIVKYYTGKKSHFWAGGKSFEPYSAEFNNILKRVIIERDNYQCQECHKNLKHRFRAIHHIDYEKKNCNPNNLIALCRKCHAKTNTNRQYWTKHFKKKIKNIYDTLKRRHK